jgi:hypothetical protein
MGFCWGYLRIRDHLEDKHGWEDNIRMDLKGIGWEGMDVIHMPQDRD